MPQPTPPLVASPHYIITGRQPNIGLPKIPCQDIVNNNPGAYGMQIKRSAPTGASKSRLGEQRGWPQNGSQTEPQHLQRPDTSRWQGATPPTAIRNSPLVSPALDRWLWGHQNERFGSSSEKRQLWNALGSPWTRPSTRTTTKWPATHASTTPTSSSIPTSPNSQSPVDTTTPISLSTPATYPSPVVTTPYTFVRGASRRKWLQFRRQYPKPNETNNTRATPSTL